MEDISESLEAPCSSFKFDSPTVQKVTIDFVNDSYLMFAEQDAVVLKQNFRMIFESLPINTTQDDKALPPYILLPEQVVTLIQYGHAVVRKLKEENKFESEIFQPASFKKETSEEEMEKAKKIAIGRKAKELKRKMMSGGNAKAMKVRAKDLDGIAVSENEVLAVLDEIGKVEVVDERVNLALCPILEENYSFLDMHSLILPNTKEFRMKRLVFHDLWRRGFYLTAGLRFGCHYLAYEGLPGEVHAKFLVKCVDAEENLSPMELISLSRVATQVKKTVMLAFVANDNHIPHYMTTQWWKPF